MDGLPINWTEILNNYEDDDGNGFIEWNDFIQLCREHDIDNAKRDEFWIKHGGETHNKKSKLSIENIMKTIAFQV